MAGRKCWGGRQSARPPLSREPCAEGLSAGGGRERAPAPERGSGEGSSSGGVLPRPLPAASRPPRQAPGKRTLAVTHEPRQAAFPFLGGGRARSLGPPDGPHSLSPQLRRGRKGLPRVPGPGRWHPGLSLGQRGHRGQRGQRAAREPAAAGPRAEPRAQAGCGTGRARRPRARSGATLGANMLGGRQPCDARERGAPGAARSGSRGRSPAGRTRAGCQAPGASGCSRCCGHRDAPGEGGELGNRAPVVLGQLANTLPSAPGATAAGVGVGGLCPIKAGERSQS